MLGAADHKEAVKKMPWSVIVMMSGVTVLIALLEKTGGLDLFTAVLAALATPGTHHRRHRVRDRPDLGLQQHVGRRPAGVPADGARARSSALAAATRCAIATSMNIGAHLVDMSPLSTTGALCLAGVSPTENVRSVFNKLLAWGLSMTVVGAVISYHVLLGWLRL